MIADFDASDLGSLGTRNNIWQGFQTTVRPNYSTNWNQSEKDEIMEHARALLTDSSIDRDDDEPLTF